MTITHIFRMLKTAVGKTFRAVIEVSLFAGIIVIQKGDTLQFMKNNVIHESHILKQDSIPMDNGYVVHTQQAKVSGDKKHFLLYDEYRNSSIDSLLTSVSLYTSQMQLLWMQEYANDRRVDFERTKIFNNDVAITSTDRTYGEPVLEYIHDNKTDVLIEKTQWQRLVDFDFSPNMRYIALHVRNPHARKMWDFVYFIDCQTNGTWTYLFPICISCKRNRITLEVDNNGNTEIIYKQQHRVFDKTGTLIDFFMQLPTQ